MKFRPARLKPIHGEYLEVVSFINCLFLILIFLMLTWHYSVSATSGIRVNLPGAVTSQAVAGEADTISITREKVIYFNGEVVSSKELALKLEGLSKDKPILIKADRGTSLERVVEVWDICRSTKRTQVNIATTCIR